jgi:ethanolaminephosphotransferase
MWLYSTLDNVDGKQARRTNSSSPLGELFDHGCDALNCSIGGLIQIAAMGMGYSNMAILMLGISN